MSGHFHDPYRPASAQSTSGSSPAAAEPENDEKVPSGTTKEILEWVGDDKERAEQALAAEEENSQPRKGLVSDLHKILDKDESEE